VKTSPRPLIACHKLHELSKNPRPAWLKFEEGFCPDCNAVIRFDPEFRDHVRKKMGQEPVLCCIRCAQRRQKASGTGPQIVDVETSIEYFKMREGN